MFEKTGFQIIFLIDASVVISIEDPIALAVALADDNAAKCGEWGDVHGLRHSNALIDDLFSGSVDATEPSMFLFPGNNVSDGEIGDGWKECEVMLPWVGETGGDEEEKLFLPVNGGELHGCWVNDDGGRGVGSGERWGLLTRLLGSIWGGGGPSEPSCMDKKYFVAACRSCSLSSAVCRLLKANRKEVKISISSFIECGGSLIIRYLRKSVTEEFNL